MDILSEVLSDSWDGACEVVERLWSLSTVARYWREWIEIELSMLWWFRRSGVGRAVAWPFRHVISGTPHRDISCVTWAFFLAGVFVSGYKFSAICFVNLCGCSLTRALLQCRRPCEYDASLRQLADRSRGSYGFPSVESHMSVVVLAQLAALSASAARGQTVSPEGEAGAAYDLAPALQVAAWTAAVSLMALIGLSRLVAGSRFAWQVAASYATGAAGLANGRKLLALLPEWREDWHRLSKNRPQALGLLVAVAIAVCVLAHYAEDNSSHYFSIPNAEFERVMKRLYADRSKAPGPLHRAALKNARAHATAHHAQLIQPADSLAILTARLKERTKPKLGT